MTGETTQLFGAGLIVGVLGPILWYLLREMRAGMNGMAREVSDLTLMIALDIATRVSANEPTRAIARQMVKDRDQTRAREMEQGG